MDTLFKNRSIPILLVLLILFHLGINLVWLKQDTTYFINDPHHHTLLSFAVFDEFNSGGIPALEKTLDRITMHHRWHGVLAAYVTAPFFFLLGKTQDAATAALSFVFLPILLLSVFGIGKKIRDEKAGLLAACILSLYPLIFNHLRLYMLDLPLTALVSLSIYLLLRSDYFTNKGYTILFSLSAALGMLCKVNFIAFIAGPLLYGAGKMFTPEKREERRRWALGLFILLCVTSVALVPFLKLKRWEVIARLTEYCWLNPGYYRSAASAASFVRGWSIALAKFYFWLIPEFINTVVSFVFFVALCVAAWPFARNPVRQKTLLVLWALVPLAVISVFFVSLTVTRYIMPLLPAVALVTAIGLLSIKRNVVRRLLITVFLGWAFFQFAMLSFNPLGRFHPALDITESTVLVDSRLTKGRVRDIFLWYGGTSLGFRNGKRDVTFPQGPSFDAGALLQKIIASADDPADVPNICFIDVPVSVYEPVEYLAYKDNYPLAFTVNSPNAESSQKDSLEPFYFVACADYVVVGKNGAAGTMTEEMAARAAQARSALQARLASFRLIATFLLPDGNPIFLYKNKRSYAKLEAGALKLYFREGVIRLYARGRILTRSYGMSSRFIRKGSEVSSNEGEWRVEYSGKGSICASVSWPGTAITQRWVFEARPDDTLSLTIQTDLPGNADVTRAGFLLSLVPEYHYWRKEKARQRFSSQGVRDPVYLPLTVPLEPLIVSGSSVPALCLRTPDVFRNAWFADQKDGPVLILRPRCQADRSCRYSIDISLCGE